MEPATTGASQPAGEQITTPLEIANAGKDIFHQERLMPSNPSEEPHADNATERDASQGLSNAEKVLFDSCQQTFAAAKQAFDERRAEQQASSKRAAEEGQRREVLEKKLEEAERREEIAERLITSLIEKLEREQHLKEQDRERAESAERQVALSIASVGGVTQR